MSIEQVPHPNPHGTSGQVESLVLTVKQLAEQMQISLPTAYELTNREGFPVIRVGTKKLIPIEPLKDWLRKEAERKE